MDSRFSDFDDAYAYQKLVDRAKSADAKNFVLDFSHDKARCAFDVDESEVKSLLDTEVGGTMIRAFTRLAEFQQKPPAYSTRWINIWGPDRQTRVVDRLAAKYGFSPRLRGLMKSKHVLHAAKRPKSRQSMSNTRPTSSSSTSKTPKSIAMKSLDVEKQPSQPEKPESEVMRNLNHYDIVSSIYHWTSVDPGVKYFCIGYNMLHNVRPARAKNLREDLNFSRPKLPHGDRVWNWLILCDDRTVISISEDPYYMLDPTARKTHDASSTRSNLLNVFQQLSNMSHSPERNPIYLVPIRHTESSVEDDGYSSQLEDRQSSELDGPGLLFYYLFDDWWNTYALLTKRDHHYGAELNRLRDEMVSSPRVDHVYSLQHVGRQLACLKRIYESYEIVIMRILEKQRMPMSLSLPTHGPDRDGAQTNGHQPSFLASFGTHASDAPSPLTQSPTQPYAETLFSRPVCVPVPAYRPPPYHPNQYWSSPPPTAHDQYGIYLTSGARVRFERLRDRVRLYAIAEIIESIDLKESLATMNYNLIAVKESNTMERLTRVTTLLSKATILFLPVSLLSAYFGIQWGDPAGETVKSYWVCFAVIFGVTFVLLIVFGAVSRTLEGKVIYQPLWRAGVEGWRGLKQVGERVGLKEDEDE